MIRAALDVNVLASGFPNEQGTPAEVLARWAEVRFEMVLSEHILSGLEYAWNKPYFRARYGATEAQQTLLLLRSKATIVVPDSTVRGVADDEEDDLVLATAVAGGAAYLVTGDKGLLAVGSFRGVAIVTPRRFLDLLDAARVDDD